MLKLVTGKRSTHEVRRLDRQPRIPIEQCDGMLERSRCSSDGAQAITAHEWAARRNGDFDEDDCGTLQ